jgi:hypothetical protein
MTFRKKSYRKLIWIFFALTLIITAIEDVATYVDIKVYSLHEVGQATNYIDVHGLEMGLLFSFVHSTSLAFLALFYCLFYFKISDVISTKGKLLKDYTYFFFILALMTLGAMSLMNLPAAVNDVLAPVYGGGPLILFINLLTIIFILLGVLISIVFITFRKKGVAEKFSNLT